LEDLAVYDIENIKKLPQLGSAAPEAWKAFLAFDKAALADGVIPKKYKELIALAVALTTQCPYCLAIHKDAAAKAGATAQEIAEVTFVAAALRAGAAVTHGTHLVGS
jgi:AhpD family alkylhydroperoxidase